MKMTVIQKYVRDLLQDDRTGHDMRHIERVASLAQDILKTEPQADTDLTMAIVYLHEIFDVKLDLGISLSQLEDLLKAAEIETGQGANLLHSIQNLSYTDNLPQRQVLSLEGQIAQDADRLDAMGAIGIARTFYYGGVKGQSLYTDQDPREVIDADNYHDNDSAINHFYEKLLKLKDIMNTDRGRELAQERHEFMICFLDRFNQETGR